MGTGLEQRPAVHTEVTGLVFRGGMLPAAVGPVVRGATAAGGAVAAVPADGATELTAMDQRPRG